MAWDDELTEVLRVMVQDLADPPANSDDSLLRVLLVCAQIVEGELDFSQAFVVDVLNQTIRPDPTDRAKGTRDDNFVNLVCMRAAAVVDQGAARRESGIVIRDNGSMVDLHYKLQAALDLVRGEGGWMRQYQDAKFAYQSGLLTGKVAGQAVMGPIRAAAREWGFAMRDERDGYF